MSLTLRIHNKRNQAGKELSLYYNGSKKTRDRRRMHYHRERQTTEATMQSRTFFAPARRYVMTQRKIFERWKFHRFMRL